MAEFEQVYLDGSPSFLTGPNKADQKHKYHADDEQGAARHRLT